MYTVIGGLNSRTFRVLWMLEELGLPYTHINAAPHAPEVTANSALGKIPVLMDGETAITDSVAILTYLADKHSGLTAKAGTPDRALQDAMTQRIVDEFDGALWTAARHSFVLPAEHRVPEVKATAKWEFARSEAGLVRDMGPGPFLMGAGISIPDLVLTHCLGWAIVAKFGISEAALSAYLNRMKDRPAYRLAREKAAS